MESYELTLRFNNDEQTLSAKNGLPINQLGELLAYLGKAVNLKDNSLTLSEIKGNCYAITFSTPKLPLYDTLKSIHSYISKGNFEALTIEQAKYAEKLNNVLDGKYTLNVYDENKTFDYKIASTTEQKITRYYHEIDDVYGIISSIGGRSLESQPYIKLSDLNYEISISESQERSLLKYFKYKKLLFKLNKKIDFSTDRVISAELLEYEISKESDLKFIDSVNTLLRKKKKRSLFPKIKDSVESVRLLRGNINKSYE